MDTYHDVECPYCGKQQDICTDDGCGTAEGVIDSQECVGCEKTFVYTTAVSFTYSPQKAPCFNGGSHLFEKTITYPEEFARLRCKYCGEERNHNPHCERSET